MITQEQAAAIAFHTCGVPPNDPRRGWDLTEFEAGWLITEHAKTPRRVAVTRVIERESGRVMSFPPSVPPSLIMQDYEAVLRDGVGVPEER
ncbi:MAG TPA: hypothetical protein VIL16_15000 [Trebonia sp.]